MGSKINYIMRLITEIIDYVEKKMMLPVIDDFFYLLREINPERVINVVIDASSRTPYPLFRLCRLRLAVLQSFGSH